MTSKPILDLQLNIESAVVLMIPFSADCCPPSITASRCAAAQRNAATDKDFVDTFTRKIISSKF